MSYYNYNNLSVNDVEALCYDYFNGAGAYQSQNTAFQSYLSQATSPSLGSSSGNSVNGGNSGSSASYATKSVYDTNGIYSSSRYM
jgi:hypothetical protein